MGRRLEGLVRLDHIQVMRVAAAAYDYQITFLWYFDRLFGQVSIASRPVRRLPISAEQVDRSAAFIYDACNGKGRFDLRDDFHKCFVDGVSIEQSRIDACTPRFDPAVKGELVRLRDRSRRRQARTNQLSPAGKTGKLMERNAANDNDMIVFDERPV